MILYNAARQLPVLETNQGIHVLWKSSFVDSVCIWAKNCWHGTDVTVYYPLIMMWC